MRWLLPALAAMGVVLWVDALLGDDLAGSVPGLVLVVVMAGLAGWHARLPGLVITGLAVAALLAVANQAASPGEFSFANDGVFYAVVVLAPALAAWLVGTRSRQVLELRAHTAELEERRAETVAAARIAEAERVERHVDHALTERLGVIVAGAREAHRLAISDPAGVPSRLAQMESTAREALAELREVLGVLRPTSEEPPPPLVATQPEQPGRHRLDKFDVLLLLAVVPLAVETALAEHGGPVWLDVAASVGQGLLLIVVRRSPPMGSVALFVLASAQSAWLTPLMSTVSWLLPGLLVSFLLGVNLPRRRAPWGLLVALLGLGAVILATPAASRDLGATVAGVLMIALAWGAGRSVAVREARATALRLVLDELARTRDEQARLAAAEQRAEMARELHDVSAHALTVVCLQAGAAQTWWERDPERARASLDAVRELADGSLSHLRDSLRGLAADDGRHPLDRAALDSLAGLGKVLGLRVSIDVVGQAQELGGPIARAAFRVVQESLTNSARHAAHSTVRVSLDYTGDMLQVQVLDPGPGPGPATPPVTINGSGVGLRGMRERVEACGGELVFGPYDAGFSVRARLPMRPLSTTSGKRHDVRRVAPPAPVARPSIRLP